MPKRLRQHVNPLKASSLLQRDALELPENSEIEVELGCGDGLFLVDRAAQYPNRLFIGLDIRAEILRAGRKEAAARGYTHVRLEESNFIVDLEQLFPRGTVAAFWINFPDPWFKRRHHNRRWLTPEAVGHLIEALQPGGSIFYQSDVWAPAIEALGLLELAAPLRNTCGPLSFSRQPFVTQQTSRERQCLELGRKIWRIHMIKADEATNPS